MRRREMAAMSVDLMTEKLIKVEEVFAKLPPDGVATELSDTLPKIVRNIVQSAGKKHIPKVWEHLPVSVKLQIEEDAIAASPPAMAGFIGDLQSNIKECFDLKHCAVERLAGQPKILNEIFMECGAEEFEFIKNSGFYLGFFFGLFQMILWLFVRSWWILPLCGIVVGYATNVVALKVIFHPVLPHKLCCCTVQGLFLQRQQDVSKTYSRTLADKVLTAQVLMKSLCTGPRSEKMYDIVSKHIAHMIEDRNAHIKPLFLATIGAESWINFREGVCAEFREKVPTLLTRIEGYAQKKLDLETTLRTRLEKLPCNEFERLLHAVFEQDEIKLILVGALLGAIVGFLQAIVQTPEQLGIDIRF